MGKKSKSEVAAVLVRLKQDDLNVLEGLREIGESRAETYRRIAREAGGPRIALLRFRKLPRWPEWTVWPGGAMSTVQAELRAAHKARLGWEVEIKVLDTPEPPKWVDPDPEPEMTLPSSCSWD